MCPPEGLGFPLIGVQDLPPELIPSAAPLQMWSVVEGTNSCLAVLRGHPDSSGMESGLFCGNAERVREQSVYPGRTLRL